MIFGQKHGFGCLGRHAVHDKEDRRLVGIGQPDRTGDKVGDFLSADGGEDRDAVITVSAAAGGHVVVTLGAQDVTIARADAHGVDHQAGQAGSGHEGNGLLHERHAGTGTGCGCQGSGAGGSGERTRDGKLAFHLHHFPPVFGKNDSHALHDVSSRRNRIRKMVLHSAARKTFGKVFRVFQEHCFLSHSDLGSATVVARVESKSGYLNHSCSYCFVCVLQYGISYRN